MARYKLTVEYNGASYFGWQRQPDLATIQGALEDAATKLDGEAVTVRGAGRTDAGVHATGQVAEMDLSKARPIHKIADAMNYHLRPQPIAVLKVEAVSDAFSARFDALTRYYRYLICNRRADLTLQRGLAWRVPMALDADAMDAAAQQLVGVHDFSTFRDSECQAKSPVRTLDAIKVTRSGDMIEVTCHAQSFLHRQVRSMVGSLVDVGRGKRPSEWISEILEARDRKACGPVAPSDGLYLERVVYPGDE
ncbi:MAG: tRNA pseudouridine(38-40) synthase TruA [Alphaproteobacteria bacterium]|nr:tRNA pseudouridine(38-40) synthase TruA [Alphaproteobacteria bacterium]